MQSEIVNRRVALTPKRFLQQATDSAYCVATAIGMVAGSILGLMAVLVW